MSDQLKSTWVLGMHKAKSKEGVRYQTAHFELHPNFINNTFYDDFDMALVTLDRRITFNHNIMPICLPSPGSSHIDQTAIVAGW